jgi:hypothetical protein
LIQGTFREDRHGDEIVSPVGALGQDWPKPPRWLTARERQLWRTLKKHCGAWSTSSDFLAIHGIVSLTDLFLRCREDEATEGTTSVMRDVITTALPKDLGTQQKVQFKESPYRTQQVRILKELRAYLALQGLSAVDRARMRLPPEAPAAKQASPLDELIANARR